jgi:hypothetical protein
MGACSNWFGHCRRTPRYSLSRWLTRKRRITSCGQAWREVCGAGHPATTRKWWSPSATSKPAHRVPDGGGLVVHGGSTRRTDDHGDSSTSTSMASRNCGRTVLRNPVASPRNQACPPEERRQRWKLTVPSWTSRRASLRVVAASRDHGGPASPPIDHHD